MYYLVSQDSSILLSNDKKVIVNSSWEDVKKLFSNGGKVIFSLKKIRDYIENDLVTNVHFGLILQLSESLNASPNSDDSNIGLFQSFLMNANALTKFIKSLKGQSEEQYKTPGKRVQAMKSPERPKTQTLINSEGGARTHRAMVRRLASPEAVLKPTQNDFKNDVNTEIFKQETVNLVQSADKKNQLKTQKLNLMNIQLTIKKMKFEMEREEKLAMKEQEKKEELDHLEF